MPKIPTMIRKLLFSLLVVGFSLLAANEAEAMSCFIYCPPGMQQQIIGYQAYPYYTPRTVYDLNYGYAPIYGGGNPYGGYNPYGGGYGPMYGQGYGGAGGYNPNWLNQGFPFSYPRGMVNLRPRSANPSGRGYTAYSSSSSTPRDPRPEPRPSVLPNRDPPPVVAVPIPTTPTAPSVVTTPPAPAQAEERVVDCKDLEKTTTRRTTVAGDANGSRCDAAAERFKARKDRVYIEHFNMAESSLCTIRYMDKADYDKCVKPPVGPAAPTAPVTPPATAASEVPRDRSGDCIAGQGQNCEIATTIPLPESAPALASGLLGCPPGQARDPLASDKSSASACIPCVGPGYMVTGSGFCGCAAGYGEDDSNGQRRCTPPPPRATEGDVPVCKDGRCQEAALPVTDPTKCQYTVGGKVLDFDCACTSNNKIYPSPAFSQPTSAKRYDSKFEEALNEDATLAICMHQNMKTGLGKNGHLECSKSDEAGKRNGSGYCFTPEYYTDTFKAFKEAAACFGLSQEEKDQMFAKMAVESKFHTDAVNPGDPSVGIGQIHYGVSESGRSFTAKELKETNRYDNYISEASCLTKFHKLRQQMGEFSTKNSANNHLCSAVQSPEQGMFYAMAVFKNKKDAVNAILNQTCKGMSIKGKDAFESIDDTLRARLTSLAYNMGEGNLQGVICSYAQAKNTSNSSYRSSVGWTLTFNRENIIQGGTDLDANTSVRPTTGFWGLVQTYYNDRASQAYKRECMANGGSSEECSQMNYVYAMNERSKATSAAAGVQCPKP